MNPLAGTVNTILEQIHFCSLVVLITLCMTNNALEVHQCRII
jgi:hypothetical protein